MDKAFFHTKFLMVGLLSLLIIGPVQADPLLLKSSVHKFKIGKYLSILEDKNGELTFDDILKGNHKQTYTKSQKDSPNLGFTNSTIWLKFSLTREGPSKDPYILVYEFPGLDRIEFYQKIKDTWKKEISGDNLPFSSKKIPHRFFAFEIFPEKNSVYYMKLKNSAAMQIPLTIYTPEAFQKDNTESVLGFAFYLGIIFIMVCYHMVIYFSTKMADYFTYSLYLLGWMSTTLALSGFGGQYIFPQLTWFNNAGIPFSLGFLFISLITFLYSFLEINLLNKYFIKAYYTVIGISLFNIAGTYIFPFKFSIRFLIVNAVFAILFILVSGFFAIKGKHKSSKYFIYAFSLLIIGGLCKLFNGLGFLPSIFIFTKGFYIGVVSQMILFSLGLAAIINSLKLEAQEKAKIISKMNANLEEANKNLEDKVQIRTLELHSSLEKIHILMDNMGQSVFAINSESIIVPPVSKHSQNIFGKDIEGLNIWETLFKDLDKKGQAYSTLEFAFTISFMGDSLQWELISDKLPTKFHVNIKDEKRSLKTVMRPIVDKDDFIEKIMFIVEDVTEIEKLEADVLKQKNENAKRIEKLHQIVSNSKENLMTFFKESYDLFQLLNDSKTIKETFLRAVHTLKGITRLYGLNFLSTKTHFIEGKLGELLNNEKKDHDINKKKNELVLQLKNEFDSTLETVQEVYGQLFDPTQKDLVDDHTIEIKRSLLNKTVKEIDDLIQSQNYPPILTIIKKLSLIEVTNMTRGLGQIVNNTSKSLDKKVELEIKGDEVYLGEKEIALLKEGLIHLLTNCVDHGIEKIGKIFVSIKEEVNNLIINIKDNGRGMDQEKILTKAIINKLTTEEEGEQLNSQEIFNFIFHPGFSTKENVSETSGRGLGMDVVKKNITGLGGQISIESKINEGTTFTITLPIY